MEQLLKTLHDARTQLSRRLLLGLAFVAPFAARQARAADRVKFADLWAEGADADAAQALLDEWAAVAERAGA